MALTVPSVASRRRFAAARCRWLRAAIGLCAIASCTELDTSDANRCVRHDDCHGGRACVDSTCQPWTAAFEASRPEGATPPMDGAIMDGRIADGPEGSDGASGDGMEAGGPRAAMQDDARALRDASPTGAGPEVPDSAVDAVDPGEPDPDSGNEPTSDWRPSALSGLVLWLDAAEGVTREGASDAVKGWQDLSGTENHAAQSDTDLQPRAQSGAVNGHPAIDFDGQDDYLSVEDDASLNMGIDAVLIMVVAAWTNVPLLTPVSYGYGALISKQIPIRPYPGLSLWANADFGSHSEPRLMMLVSDNRLTTSVTSGPSNLNDGVFRLHAGRRRTDTSTLEATVNGVLTGTPIAPSVNADSVGAILLIGGTLNAAQALDGAIAELVIVRGEVSPEDIARLNTYFDEKYRLGAVVGKGAL